MSCLSMYSSVGSCCTRLLTRSTLCSCVSPLLLPGVPPPPPAPWPGFAKNQRAGHWRRGVAHSSRRVPLTPARWTSPRSCTGMFACKSLLILVYQEKQMGYVVFLPTMLVSLMLALQAWVLQEGGGYCPCWDQ